MTPSTEAQLREILDKLDRLLDLLIELAEQNKISPDPEKS